MIIDLARINGRLGYAAAVEERDIRTAIDFAAKHGLRAVELNMDVPVFFPENYSLEEKRFLREYITEKDITLTLSAPSAISLIQLHDIVREAGLIRHKEIIDFAVDIGAPRVTLQIGSPISFTPDNQKQALLEHYEAEYREILTNSLIDLREYAKGKTVLCIKNAGYFAGFVQEVLNELLPQGGLYLAWDVGHSFGNSQGEEDFLEAHLDKIRNCYLHDHNGQSAYQVLGTGKIDFRYYFRLLQELDTYFIFELSTRQQVLDSLQNYREIYLK